MPKGQNLQEVGLGEGAPRVHPILLVFLGGGAGALSRVVLLEVSPSHQPWSLLALNSLGVLLLGLLTGLWEGRQTGLGTLRVEEARLLLGVGFLGGFTTYSSLALTLAQLALAASWGAALTLAALSLLTGYLLALVGLQAGSYLGRRSRGRGRGLRQAEGRD